MSRMLCSTLIGFWILGIVANIIYIRSTSTNLPSLQCPRPLTIVTNRTCARTHYRILEAPCRKWGSKQTSSSSIPLPLCHLDMRKLQNMLTKRIWPKSRLQETRTRPRQLGMWSTKKCAVVSSGGVLLGSGCGSDIDGYDHVFRINCPVTRGFEADVGSRTDVHILNGMISRIFVQGNSTVPGAPPRSCHTANGIVILYAAGGRDTKNWNRREFVNKQGFRELWRLGRYAKNQIMNQVWAPHGEAEFLPTKGLLTILLALFLCGRVDAYGFLPPTRSAEAVANSPLPYHYWEGNGSKPFQPRAEETCNREKPDAEHLLLRDLASAASATRPKANGAICA